MVEICKSQLGEVMSESSPMIDDNVEYFEGIIPNQESFFKNDEDSLSEDTEQFSD